MPILGPNGRPISSADFQNKKEAPPKLGPAFGDWAGRDVTFATLPGGGVVQFDLSKLELGDYRAMRDHYQVNASLAVLSFMQHQADWRIECDDKKIADYCEEELHNNWTMLNRTMSTANWAGYSPSALEWENDVDTRSVRLDKIKDLIPEECDVNWKFVEGWAPPDRVKPKFKVYDGIRQLGTSGWPIPVENSFWYPLLMENGDYQGRKLLRPAFTSWFFSILVHLFANRYYERFGEPTPVGRAPFDEEIDVDGSSVRGSSYMLNVLQQLRNRSVVVLPTDRTYDQAGRASFDYDIEYLESQMRGADFERYLTRLDEEISIGLFTPILLLRTADVGSYNLGVGHMQMYLWMLNAMNDDRALYIDKYLLRKMVNYNFSIKAPDAKIKFRKLGNSNIDLVSALLTAIIQKDQAKVDLVELGQMAGLTLTEVRQTTAEPAPADPNANPDTGSSGNPDTGGNAPTNRESISLAHMMNARSTVKEIVNRVRPQVQNAFKDGTFDQSLRLSMGFKNRMVQAISADGIDNALAETNQLYAQMDRWIEVAASLGLDEFSRPEDFVDMFASVLENKVRALK